MSVRCSYCYDVGHNRTTCPKRKERVRQLRQGGSTEHWLVKEEDRRIAAKNSKTKTRRCSYCGETGHNRRSCSELGMAKRTFQKYQSRFRNAIFNDMMDRGLGVGAIIQLTSRDYDYDVREYVDNKVFRIVTGINWKGINVNETYQRYGTSAIISLPLDNLVKQSGWTHVAYPATEGVWWDPSDPVDRRGYQHRSQLEMISPVSADVVLANRPEAEWFSGELGLAQQFDKETSEGVANHWLNSIKDISEFYTFLKD